LWILIQNFFIYIVAIPRTEWLLKENVSQLWILSVFTHGFGDGFAEIIGARFGKYKYQV